MNPEQHQRTIVALPDVLAALDGEKLREIESACAVSIAVQQDSICIAASASNENSAPLLDQAEASILQLLSPTPMPSEPKQEEAPKQINLQGLDLEQVQQAIHAHFSQEEEKQASEFILLHCSGDIKPAVLALLADRQVTENETGVIHVKPVVHKSPVSDEEMTRDLPVPAAAVGPKHVYVCESSPNLVHTTRPCFCCSWRYLCFGWSSACFENPQPCKARVVNQILSLLYWKFNMYPGAGEFNRAGIDAIFDKGEAARAAFAQVCQEMGSVNLVREEHFVPSTELAGHQIPIIMYQNDPQRAAGVRKVFCYMHGGGYVFGSAFSPNDEATCIALATAAAAKEGDGGFLVCSIAYRHCPESTLEQILWDAYNVVFWLQERYPGAEFILGGVSAGGNLTCALTSILRDGLNPSLQSVEQSKPRILANVYITPWLGLELYVGKQHAMSRNTPFLEQSTVVFFYEQVLGKGKDAVEHGMRTERRFNALLAGYHGFPRIVMVSAGADYLRHENDFAAQVFAKELGEENVVRIHYASKTHAFNSFASNEELKELAQRIMQALEK